jgi:hypothetical protein
MVTNSQFIAVLLIAGLLGIGVALTYNTHNAQALHGYAYIQPVTAYDCTQPNPPPSCYNSGYINHNTVSHTI